MFWTALGAGGMEGDGTLFFPAVVMMKNLPLRLAFALEDTTENITPLEILIRLMSVLGIHCSVFIIMSSCWQEEPPMQ